MITASRKIDYGIMLMASLPESSSDQFRSISDVAEERNLSSGFLSQVMMPLKKAGLVIAKEGVHGGYQLSRPSIDIKLSDIYTAIEGPIKMTDCLKDNKNCACEKTCPTKGLWADLQHLMSDYLQHRRLSEFKSA